MSINIHFLPCWLQRWLIHSYPGGTLATTTTTTRPVHRIVDVYASGRCFPKAEKDAERIAAYRLGLFDQASKQ